MNYEEMKQALIEAAEAAGVREYEIYSEESSAQSVETYLHEISQFSSETGFGICLRCIWNGKPGYAATEVCSKEEAARLVSAAIANAELIESADEVSLHEAGDTYEEKTTQAEETAPTKDLIRLALACQEAAYAADERVADGTQSAVMVTEKTVRIYNSRGLDLKNRISGSAAYVSAIVKQDGSMYDGMEYRFAPIPEISADETAREAVERAVSTIGAGTAATGRYPVVLKDTQMGALLRSFFEVFSAENAQKGLSLLRGREGENIAAECLTLVDDPFYPGYPAQQPFDAEGVATRKKNVIEKGVLRTLLHNRKTAAKAKAASTGNAARAGYAGAVTIAPYSFYIEPGTQTQEELFAKAEGGIYVTQLQGLHAGTNAVTGDFSLECRGFVIEGGRAARPVQSFTIAGNFFELLKKVEAVGNEVKFGVPRGGTRYGAPCVRVSEMAVAGE